MADGIGRTRRQLAALLQEQGYEVDPADLSRRLPAAAGLRLGRCRWAGRGRTVEGYPIHLYGRDAMRDCVRAGIRVADDDGIRALIYARLAQPASAERAGG